MFERLFAFGENAYGYARPFTQRRSVSWTVFAAIWLGGVVSFFVFLSSLGVLHLMLAITLGGGLGTAVFFQDRVASRVGLILIGISAGLASLGLLILSLYVGWWAFGIAVLAVTFIGHLGMRAVRRDVARSLTTWWRTR